MLQYVLEEEYYVHVFPEGVVALDVDAPTPEYYQGAPMRRFFFSKVHNMAAMTADLWNLGRFWIISTKSGFHVIFEKKSDAWAEIVQWASEQDWGECKGHRDKCHFWGCCMLRVDRKGPREWDLEWEHGPLDGAPDFVREHYLYIKKLKEMNV